MIPKHLKWRLWGIFAGGAALGVVGWWMVSSGLAGTVRVSVSQYRLAFHLTLACAIFAAILWTAQQLRAGPPRPMPARLRGTALAIMLLVLLQLYLGALVAGSGAGRAYNTWPLIDGAFVPSAESLFHMTPAWRNLFENILTVQFDHRMVAYTIWIVAVLHALDAFRARRAAAGATILAVLVTLQAALGIVTLVAVVPLPLALAHQMFAIVVFTAAIVHAERLSPREAVPVARAVTVEQGA
jgi:cytochrome c oxidase assembly protein subunit 15